MTNQKLLLQKVKDGESLKESERENLAQGDVDTDGFDFEMIKQIEGDKGRWTQAMETIFKLDGKLYSIGWYSGLTEGQEDEFYEDPIPVKKVEKTMVVAEYVRL